MYCLHTWKVQEVPKKGEGEGWIQKWWSKLTVKSRVCMLSFGNTLENSMMSGKELIQTKFKLKVNSKKKQMTHEVWIDNILEYGVTVTSSKQLLGYVGLSSYSGIDKMGIV